MRHLICLLGCTLIAASCGGAKETNLFDPIPDAGKDAAVVRPTVATSGKVDLLIAVDNSASMGDKQELMKQTVPDIVARLLSPLCIPPNDANAPGVPRQGATCPAGTVDEFPPVVDLHVGIVSSSLGGGGSPDVCNPPGKNPLPGLDKFDRHYDDKGHLLNRKRPNPASPPASGVEDVVPNAVPKDGSGGNFLAWLPADPRNQGKPAPNVTPEPDSTTLIADFQALVEGTQEFGCGLEAQLESWYRFLIQPDPWDSITLDTSNPPKATLVGVDRDILKMRKDFLRPDSAVVIVQITDEPDSWADPLAISGRGWTTRTLAFPGSPTQLMPHGTSFCSSLVDTNNPTKTGPNNPNCTSCGFAGNMQNGLPISDDPSCTATCGTGCKGFYMAKEEGVNARFTSDMKRRFGFDPQFPVQRYIDGLTSDTVPNREGEHKNNAGSYLGKKNCTNPLFAQTLPTDPNGDLCNLAFNKRSPQLVHYVLIGGVPWQLLADTSGTFVNKLDAKAWQKIVGRDPQTYQIDGIDPHMIESIPPRSAIVTAGAGPTSADTTDPYHGREWSPDISPLTVDLQFACTFALPTPKDCTLPENKPACDCVPPLDGAGGPPLCDVNPNDSGNKTLQTRGKAYPTIRELLVAKGLGDQGVVGSVCPKSIDVSNPDFAYRPAIRNLFVRLRTKIVAQ